MSKQTNQLMTTLMQKLTALDESISKIHTLRSEITCIIDTLKQGKLSNKKTVSFSNKDDITIIFNEDSDIQLYDDDSVDIEVNDDTYLESFEDEVFEEEAPCIDMYDYDEYYNDIVDDYNEAPCDDIYDHEECYDDLVDDLIDDTNDDVVYTANNERMLLFIMSVILLHTTFMAVVDTVIIINDNDWRDEKRDYYEIHTPIDESGNERMLLLMMSVMLLHTSVMSVLDTVVLISDNDRCYDKCDYYEIHTPVRIECSLRKAIY